MATPTILPTVKTALGITSSAFDELVTIYIDAARQDLLRAGVDSTVVEDGSELPLAKAAIIAYAQSHFGIEVDKDQAIRLTDSYNRITLDLLSHIETGYLTEVTEDE